MTTRSQNQRVRVRLEKGEEQPKPFQRMSAEERRAWESRRDERAEMLHAVGKYPDGTYRVL